MNEYITRRTFLAGATVLGAGVLAAACGQAAPAMDEQEMAPEKKEEAKPEAEAPSGPQGEALYWHRGFFDFEPFAAEFADLNPGLTFNAVGEADRLNKFVAAVAAGSPPDAVDVGDWQTVELGVTDISQPLNNYYKASGVLNIAEFWPSVLSYLTDAPTGNLYGAPYAPDLRVMYIHGDTYLEVGLDPENPPSSWSRFRHRHPPNHQVRWRHLGARRVPAFLGQWRHRALAPAALAVRRRRNGRRLVCRND